MVAKKEQLSEKCSLLLSNVVERVEDRISGLLSCGAIDVDSWDENSYATPRIIIAAAVADILDLLREEFSAEEVREFRNLRNF